MDSSGELLMIHLPADIMQLILRKACIHNPMYVQYYTEDCKLRDITGNPLFAWRTENQRVGEALPKLRNSRFIYRM